MCTFLYRCSTGTPPPQFTENTTKSNKCIQYSQNLKIEILEFIYFNPQSLMAILGTKNNLF